MSNQTEQFASEIAGLPVAAGDSLSVARNYIQSKLTASAAGGPAAVKQTLLALADASMTEHIMPATSSAVLEELVKTVDVNESGLDVDSRECIVRHVLSCVQQRVMAYEGVIVSGRVVLAKVLASKEMWEAAAQELREIRFDQQQRSVGINERFPVYVNAMDYYVKANNMEQATQALARAAVLVPSVKDVDQLVYFRNIQAIIYDRTHKYIEAANTLRNLSQSDSKNEEQQREVLERAIRCAVLASAGPQKMRVMAGLYREKLAPSLPSFGLLENMVLKRLIKPAEVAEFSERAHLPQDKSDILVGAVREHNVFVLSLLYTSMKFENLGRFLGVDADEAEETCARMIAERRMKGRIDQVDGIITFEGSREVEEVAAAISLKRQKSAQPPPMHFRETVAAKWDLRIVNLCQSIEDAVDLLIERQPTYARTLFRSVE